MNQPDLREEALFEAALALPAEQRPEYLDKACGEDAALRQRVLALIQAHERAGGPLEESASTLPVSTLLLKFPLAEKIGDHVGRYKLLQQIGEGGCGVVYMAEQHEPVKRRVALKVIKPGTDTRQVLARFEAERQALALMDHPNIAKILDAGATESGRPFFVMELVRGIPITRYCDEAKLSTKQRLELFIQVCQAIQHAHQKGIIHRDIKPSNILVADHDGVAVPKIIDFGIAKATAGQILTEKTLFTDFEQFIGTPAYMSPEQAKLSGLDIDTRSDIYSLGVLLYEMLTSKTPFDSKRLLAAGFDEIRRIIREEEPLCPSQKLSSLALNEQTTTARCRQAESPQLVNLLRGDLDWIVMKCLEKERGRRYETATGLALDLRRHLDDEAVLARPPSPLYRFQKTLKRHRLAVTALTAVVVAVLGGAVVSTWLYIDEARAHRRAVTAEQEQFRLREAAAAALKNEEAAHRLATNERDRYEKSEKQARAVLDFFISQVIAAARPQVEPGGLGRDATIRQAMAAAEGRIPAAFTNQPLTEAKLRSAMAYTYATLGESQTAIAQHRRALELLERELGPDAPDTIEARAALAYACQGGDRAAEARELWRQCVRSAKQAYGPDGRRTIELMCDLGVIYQGLGEGSNAAATLEQAVELGKSRLGPTDPTTLNALNALGFLYNALNRTDEAASLLENVVAVRQATVGTNDSETTRAMIDLARVYQQQGKWTNALPLLKEALESRRLHQGDNNSDTLLAMDCVAGAYLGAGLRREALPLLEEALQRREAVLGPDHPETRASRIAVSNLTHDLETSKAPLDDKPRQ